MRNVSLTLPKEKLIVLTGVSGSGKSTFLIDVLFNECQRQYLEAMGMQGIPKPKVDKVRGASPAIVITQSMANKNPRSTVGDVYKRQKIESRVWISLSKSPRIRSGSPLE